MSGIRFQSRLFQYQDSNGDPLAGGSLTFLVAGTSDLADVYTDSTLGTPQENPLDLDADGAQSADVFLDPAVEYRVVLKDALGAEVREEDPSSGSDIVAAIEAHNDDLTAHYPASESQRGFIELASQSEVNTGTDALRAVTPATLVGRTATETRVGVIELATNAEILTGTDAVRAVTPAGLASAIGTGGTLFASAAETLLGTSAVKALTPAGFAGNKDLTASKGSYKFPGGFTIQWGVDVSSTDSTQTFTFDTAFATACFGVLIGRISDDAEAPLMQSSTSPPTTTQFSINRDVGISGSINFFYLAIGA